MANLKILYHHRTMADGGEGVHIVEMVKALRMLGHDVRVVSLVGEGGNPPTRRTANRWNALRNFIPNGAYELAELGYNEVGTRRMVQAAREFSPDFIYDRYNSYSTAALRTARRIGVPLLLEVNAPVVFERTKYAHMRLRLPWLAARYETKICQGADYLCTVSSALKKYLVEERGISPHQIGVVPNAINPDAFINIGDGSEIRRAFNFLDHPIVGFVGTLRTWHGIDLLMHAIPIILEQHSTCRFLIVGYGELEDEFRQFIEEKGYQDRVVFAGRVPHSEVPRYMAAMDITLMPNSNFYGSPIKVFEYMAAGKPTIAPRLGPLEEIIEHDVSGILIESGNPASLTAAILDLLGNEEKRRRIGGKAKEIVMQRHTWRQNAEKVVGAFEHLKEKDLMLDRRRRSDVER